MELLRIERLEQEIGAQLFVPSGRGVKRSPAVRSLLEIMGSVHA